jgi:endogenous inhibitor of DNA gyrase (YacG/DUF329 family)
MNSWTYNKSHSSHWLNSYYWTEWHTSGGPRWRTKFRTHMSCLLITHLLTPYPTISTSRRWYPYCTTFCRLLDLAIFASHSSWIGNIVGRWVYLSGAQINTSDQENDVRSMIHYDYATSKIKRRKYCLEHLYWYHYMTNGKSIRDWRRRNISNIGRLVQVSICRAFYVSW